MVNVKLLFNADKPTLNVFFVRGKIRELASGKAINFDHSLKSFSIINFV
jgi:hypothetical protein